MIKPNDIIDAINRKLVEAFPDHTVYVNRCPVDCERPSFWIEYIRSQRTNVNFCTVLVEPVFSVQCFIDVDAYGNSDELELTDVQDKVIELFGDGYIRVGDRALTIYATPGGVDPDRSYVDLELEYFDDRALPAITEPDMQDVHVKIKEE